LKNKRTEITAFILSGGKSSRIGIDKALLSIEGKPLVQRLVELLDSIFPEVVISSNELDLYNFTWKKIVQDIYSGRGPLAGIHSALQFSHTEKNFIISCDMPFVSAELIKFLCVYNSDKRIILPKAEGRIQQLCGLYSKSILAEVEKLLKESSSRTSNLKGSIYELMDKVPTEIVEVDKFDFYHSNLFFNINTPEDYNFAKRILEQK